MGALCLYMLAGMFFAFVYGAIENLGGDPFFAGGDEWTPQRSVYFSFTTLTTTGLRRLHRTLGQSATCCR